MTDQRERERDQKHSELTLNMNVLFWRLIRPSGTVEFIVTLFDHVHLWNWNDDPVFLVIVETSRQNLLQMEFLQEEYILFV